VEAVEAEEGDTFGAIENFEQSDDIAIVVDAAEGNQPNSVPVVSNLANLFFGSFSFLFTYFQTILGMAELDACVARFLKVGFPLS
jgi:hypothetical protein